MHVLLLLPPEAGFKGSSAFSAQSLCSKAGLCVTTTVNPPGHMDLVHDPPLHPTDVDDDAGLIR